MERLPTYFFAGCLLLLACRVSAWTFQPLCLPRTFATRRFLVDKNNQEIDAIATSQPHVSGEPEPIARQTRVLTPLAGFIASLGALVENPAPSNALKSGKGPFQDAVKKYFSGSLTSSVITLRAVATLKKRNFKPYNMLMGSCVSCDETMLQPNSLLRRIQDELANKKTGGIFAMGVGLEGLPPLGSTPNILETMMSHSPGKLLLIFGPHVGITETGRVGLLVRPSMQKETECGITTSYLSGTEGLKKRLTLDQNDLSQDTNDANIEITNALYDLSKRTLVEEAKKIIEKPNFWTAMETTVEDITLLGGIFINRNEKEGEDFFQPLMCKSYSAQGELSLYEEMFGDLPTPSKRVNQ